MKRSCLFCSLNSTVGQLACGYLSKQLKHHQPATCNVDVINKLECWVIAQNRLQKLSAPYRLCMKSQTINLNKLIFKTLTSIRQGVDESKNLSYCFKSLERYIKGWNCIISREKYFKGSTLSSKENLLELMRLQFVIGFTFGGFTSFFSLELLHAREMVCRATSVTLLSLFEVILLIKVIWEDGPPNFWLLSVSKIVYFA